MGTPARRGAAARGPGLPKQHPPQDLQQRAEGPPASFRFQKRERDFSLSVALLEMRLGLGQGAALPPQQLAQREPLFAKVRVPAQLPIAEPAPGWTPASARELAQASARAWAAGLARVQVAESFPGWIRQVRARELAGQPPGSAREWLEPQEWARQGSLA